MRNPFCGKIAGMIYMLVFFSCFTKTPVSAAESVQSASQAAVVSSRTAGQDVSIYIKGIGDATDAATVQIGSTLCENIQVTPVADMGVPIKTTILFDNSQSLFRRWGSQAKSLITELIDNHAEGEEFRIATFADGLNIRADYSTDYDALKKTVDGIEFLDQASYLTDILYDLLKESRDSGEANYTRVIIITDGADDKEIKYTQAELTELMKNSGSVIHAVGVRTSQNSTLLENLFSYARYTGGTYSLAEEQSDVEEIKSIIDGDYLLFCLKLSPDAAVMDGSRREAKISLNTSEGTVVLTASLQMPFADVRQVSEEAATPESADTPIPAASQELPSIAIQSAAKEKTPSTEEKTTGIMRIILITVGVVFLAAAIVTAVLLTVRRKKKGPVDIVITGAEKQESGRPDEKRMASSASRSTVERGTHTANLSALNVDNVGKTLKLQNGQGQWGMRQAFIILTDINNPQRSFRAPIETRVVIGRESGDIVLGYDGSVSYVHCEIIKRGSLFYVNDLKSSNGTFYGNIRVYRETAIMNGGILGIGSGKYKVTIEN
ncbi:MAG: FHA domain-containing protein [Roseburia sp.]|nr:FHA domain-containing protein [Roseburia sp.]MCM1096831.1 FHA domain-containing protein [Ruminococcus flavefaciens]